jgi:S1-C subfamily serine protease
VGKNHPASGTTRLTRVGLFVFYAIDCRTDWTMIERMKAALSLAFAVALVHAAAAAGISRLELNDTTYTNITDVHISGGRAIILYPGGGTSATLDKLPQDFLRSWGIGADKQAAANAATAQKEARDLEHAIQTGCFRKVHGVVYDTRRRQAGWVVFQNVKVYQIVDAGALVDSAPSDYSTIPILVKNLPDTVGDSDYISFVALPDGTYSYENKLGDERVVRAYNAGKICDRSEIPPAVLAGTKPFEVVVNVGERNASARDVVSELPESDDLMASGSGFFITDDGYFITNAHVVKNARRVKIKVSTNAFPAEIVRQDITNDLALLKVAGHFKPLCLATNAGELGQAVFTIGFPDIRLQGTDPKYTDGKISSLNGIKDDPAEYQISVQVQPGNSGGPLVDQAGNVAGVIVARLDDFAALASMGSLPQNVNYAIKGSILRDFLSGIPEVKSSTPAGQAASVVAAAQQSVAMVLAY